MLYFSRIMTRSVGILLLISPHLLFADQDSALETSVSLGITLTDGNSDTSNLNLSLDGDRKHGDSEILFGGKFNYGEEDNSKNTENLYTFAQYNFHLDEAKRFYLNMKAEYSYDDIAEVDYRVLVGPPGLGYFFVKSETTEWVLEAAFQYLWEEVGGLSEDGPVLRLEERLRKDLSESAKLFHGLQYQPELEQFDSYLIIGEIGIECMINSHMSMRFTVEERYDSTPAEDKEKGDTRVIASLVYTL